MFIDARAVAARWYVGSNGKKEIKYFILSGIFTALALTAWFLVPALTPLLSIVLVPLIPYFLYSTYRLTKSIYYKYYNKENKVHNANDTTIKALTVAAPDKAIDKTACRRHVQPLLNELQDGDIKNELLEHLDNSAIYAPKETFDLATCVKKIDLIFKDLSQSINDKFYKSLMDLVLINPKQAYRVATCIRRTYNKFNEIRPHIRNKFFDSIIELAYTDRDDALVLATVVKEIDDIVSGITNKDLLDYFDQFFTFTETQHVHERTKVIEFARACKRIHDVMPINLQKISAVQAKLRPEGILPGGIIKPTEVVSYLEMVSSYAEKALSTAKSWVSFVSDARNSVIGNYFGH